MRVNASCTLPRRRISQRAEVGQQHVLFRRHRATRRFVEMLKENKCHGLTDLTATASTEEVTPREGEECWRMLQKKEGEGGGRQGGRKKGASVK